MSYLDEFVSLLSGRFDNRVQLERLAEQGVAGFPYAIHVGTVVNDRIIGLPDGFPGLFLLEESNYTVHDRTNSMPHLFLFTAENGAVKLTSYEFPAGFDKANCTAAAFRNVPFAALRPSEKFTPAYFEKENEVWSGGSESEFAPGLRFSLQERFCATQLEVSESMERDGKRIFGYDLPLVYRRIPT